MLRRHPDPEDWDRVRFSDEVHFGYGPEGQLHIIRQPGTRYRQDCIQHAGPPLRKTENGSTVGRLLASAPDGI